MRTQKIFGLLALSLALTTGAACNPSGSDCGPKLCGGKFPFVNGAGPKAMSEGDNSVEACLLACEGH